MRAPSRLPTLGEVVAHGIIVVWGLLGAYGAWHLVSDRHHVDEVEAIDYLLCYRIQRELARDGLESTETCELP